MIDIKNCKNVDNLKIDNCVKVNIYNCNNLSKLIL